MPKKKSTDQLVREALDKHVATIPGGFEALHDIVWRRNLIGMFREERIRQGLTQADLAKKMGVTQGRVAEIENERYPDPYIATLGGLAYALGMEVDLRVRPIPTENGETAPELSDREPRMKWAKVEADQCGSRGPRIGGEGLPVCKRIKGHRDPKHRPHPDDGWDADLWWLG